MPVTILSRVSVVISDEVARQFERQVDGTIGVVDFRLSVVVCKGGQRLCACVVACVGIGDGLAFISQSIPAAFLPLLTCVSSSTAHDKAAVPAIGQ